jgi:uncharacterized zinc-type alcohol dehydrogenase-like protein
MKNIKTASEFILNTFQLVKWILSYLSMNNGFGGAVSLLKPFHGGNIIMGRKRIAGSLIGGIKETQEMLDFCGEHNITSDIELIDMQDINKAYDRVTSND